MAYLYAGLGIAMMVGIMAVFEMASSFDQQQLAASSGSTAKAVAYFADVDRSAHSQFSGLTQRSPLTCVEIASNIGLGSYSVAALTGFFRCSIQSVQIDDESARQYSHRVLIDTQNSYWSCFYERTAYAPDQCSFE